MARAKRCPVCGHELGDPDAEKRVVAHLARKEEERARFVKKAREQAEAKAEKLARDKVAQAKRDAEAEANKRLREKLADAKRAQDEQLAVAVAQAVEREKKHHAIEREQTHKRVEELQRRLERHTADEHGQVTEREVFDALKQEFPEDVITLLSKRRGTVDIKHEVRDRGRTCGVIVYECKNVAKWTTEGVKQARAARATHNTRYVVVVSNVFPAGHKHLCVVRDVPVVRASLVTHLVRYMRQAIVAIAKTSSSEAEREHRGRAILQYIQCEDFSRHMKLIAEAVEDLREQQAKEQTAHQSMWAKRALSLDAILDASAKIGARVDAIVGSTRAALAKASWGASVAGHAAHRRAE